MCIRDRDRTDPIAMAYRNIYPNLFVEKEEEIPQDIASHFVYPQFLYNIQAKMYERYHKVQTEVLYSCLLYTSRCV